MNDAALLEYERRPFKPTRTDNENNIKFLLMELRKNYVENKKELPLFFHTISPISYV